MHKVALFKNVNIPYLKAKGGVTSKPVNAIWGESGAEALIPLERNLGGIKKIANVMLDGLEQAGKYRTFASPESLGFTGSISSPNSNTNFRTNNDSALIEEQNRLLAEQNRLLQQIANKDVTISSREVFKATRREAQNYNNMTGNSPFIF